MLQEENDLKVSLLRAEDIEIHETGAAAELSPWGDEDGRRFTSESGRFGSACTLRRACLLIGANFAAFWVLGGPLCSFTRMCTDDEDYDYEYHHGHHHKYHDYGDYYNDDNVGVKRGIISVGVILVTLTAVNLIAFWYWCKPSKAGRRILKSAIAVFRLRDRTRPHEQNVESTVDLCRRGLVGVGRTVLDLASSSVRCCLLPLLVFGIPSIMILSYMVNSMEKEEPKSMEFWGVFACILIVFVVVSCLWKLSAHGDYFGESEYLESISEEFADETTTGSSRMLTEGKSLESTLFVPAGAIIIPLFPR